MSDKNIKYQVNRSMQGDKPYERGDTREMTEAEAAPLLVSGALSLPGEDPATRANPVQHTFGAAPQHSPKGFTIAGHERPATEKAPLRKAAAEKA